MGLRKMGLAKRKPKQLKTDLGVQCRVGGIFIVKPKKSSCHFKVTWL